MVKLMKISGKKDWDNSLQLYQTDLGQYSWRVEGSASTSAQQPSAEGLGLGTAVK